MFSRKFRLPAHLSFTNSTGYSSLSFSLRIKKNAFAYNRYGFVVSKKVDPRATERNEVKRRFRAVIELLHPTLFQGNDLLFILKPSSKEKPFEELRKELEEILQKSGIKGKI